MEYGIGSMVFGNWKIVNLIGEGSYGKVYEIGREDFGITYRAALKVISVPQNKNEILSLQQEGMTEDETTEYFYSMVQDIVNEFALMFDLKGMTNIVGYEDHVVLKKEDGIGWDVLIRMELLTPLMEYANEQSFTRKEVIKLGIDVCKALELCQTSNIIHRDLKPENIFVSKKGYYKIGDFGIARTIEKTMSGLSKKGTYSYMAPEVYRGFRYGYTVDIYSLGIVLYRFLNKNRIPFMPEAPIPIKYSDREKALFRRIEGEKITPPFYHDEKLSEIVLKACAYDSKDRYATPKEMREALEAINLDEVDDQVIYPVSEEATPTSQVVAEQTSEVEEETVSMLEEDENTVSMLEYDENTVSMLEDDENTVSMLEDDENTVSMLVEDENIVSMLDEDENTVSMLEDDENTVSMLEKKKETFNINTSLKIDQKEKEKREVKKVLCFVVVLLLLICIGCGIQARQTWMNKPISWTDEALEAAIREDEGITAEYIYRKDLENITALSLDRGSISNIDDLKYFTNLEFLDLSDNEVSDISALKNLTSLEILSISGNEISDISRLENLTNLETLYLSDNNISDIRTVGDLTNLQNLDLSYNGISDISALGNLTNLEYLSLYGNPIEDYSPIEELEDTHIGY